MLMPERPMSAIDDLRRERDSLRARLRDAEQKYHAALIANSEYAIGQRYRDKKGRVGEVVKLRVSSYDDAIGDDIEVSVALVRKDGTLSATTIMWSWHGWELVAASGTGTAP